ncbi:phosphoribosylaminoimidazolesuccinocarboxamide synthase [Chytriomyces confervae]|uniref:Phosphoribosylaminoimidazole-succinocarboxamide synthase n=1 Tax=Chytriomyces confervae TaxID=246404 RepID=A0A507F9P9_9FUNG|nr:phosphoribosylaminoimidazolesuccinocarboxamide synthase [Chytriomyces confervae]
MTNVGFASTSPPSQPFISPTAEDSCANSMNYFQGITGKGKLLTAMSGFWFDHLKGVVGNHLITQDIRQMPAVVQKYADQLDGRCMLVKKLKILPVEAIVRGYITDILKTDNATNNFYCCMQGSGWAEYQKKGTICDIPLPKGLVESQKLDKPLFTPSTKAEIGDHDENIHPSKLAEIIGADYATKVEELALSIYSAAAEYALSKGIIIADTKFEFGVDEQGNVILADEVLTPDSSRFWPADQYVAGKGQPSYDKQFLRDFLTSIKFDKTGAGIAIPNDIVEKTIGKYREAAEILTGKRL